MQLHAREWIDSIKYVIESCQSNYFYSKYFTLSDKEKLEFYLSQEITWNFFAGGAEGKLQSKRIAIEILQDREKYSRDLIVDATYYVGNSNRMLRIIEALKYGILFHKIAKNLRSKFCSSRCNFIARSTYEPLINWYKKESEL